MELSLVAPSAPPSSSYDHHNDQNGVGRPHRFRQSINPRKCALCHCDAMDSVHDEGGVQ